MDQVSAFVVSVALWFALSFFVAAAARKRGFSFWAYFLHSYLPSPFLALVTLHAAVRGAKERYGDDYVQRYVLPYDAATRIAAHGPPAGRPPQQPPTAAIAELAKLRDSGAITEKEYQEKKEQLLDRI